MNDWIRASAAHTARAIRAGEVSSVGVVGEYLERINAVNPILNAVVQSTGEAALQRAREADATAARGMIWGPLHGVPMTIKDSFETAGVVTTAGTEGLASYTPARDASVVARLRALSAASTPMTALGTGTRILRSHPLLHQVGCSLPCGRCSMP